MPRRWSAAGQSSNEVLALARWEDNNRRWLAGGFYGLARGDTFLQRRVGDGGTLWVVVSRRAPGGGRSYALTFRFMNCHSRDFQGSRWPFAVLGDPDRSQLFASNDARLLLMSLRFTPYKPIERARVIGQSIQTPRLLNGDDVLLLQQYGAAANRWSVFVSYDRRDVEKAQRLSDALARRGISTFRDQEALRAGQHWPEALDRAVRNARHFVLLVGPHTHESAWVDKELRLACQDDKTTIIPVVAGGELKTWEARCPRLENIQAATYNSPSWTAFIDRLARDMRASSTLASPTTSAF